MGRVRVVGDKGRNQELFVPGLGALQLVARPAVHATPSVNILESLRTKPAKGPQMSAPCSKRSDSADAERHIEELEQSLQALPEDAKPAERVSLEYKLDQAKRRKAKLEPLVQEAANIAEPHTGLRIAEAFENLKDQQKIMDEQFNAMDKALEAYQSKMYVDRFIKGAQTSREQILAAKKLFTKVKELVDAAQNGLEDSQRNPFENGGETATRDLLVRSLLAEKALKGAIQPESPSADE